MIWTAKPANAWKKYIQPHGANHRWLNDGSPISDDNPLRKRELFGLIIFAHLYGPKWRVGYDPGQSEPNDGLILNGNQRNLFEHKIVVEEAKREVLEEILEMYRTQAKKGPDYGKDRNLVIQLNKEPEHGGLIKISDLAHEIGDVCHFDRVFTFGLASREDPNAYFHIHQHYPTLGGIAYLHFNLETGENEGSQCPFKL